MKNKNIHKWQDKLDSGEYLYKWRGFSPHYAGCFYGDTLRLGGEEKFSHCFDFFSGIGDVDWWIKSELDKLTDDEKDELESLMIRNQHFAEKILTPEKLKCLAEYFEVQTTFLYNLGHKSLYELVKNLNNNFKDIIQNSKRNVGLEGECIRAYLKSGDLPILEELKSETDIINN